MNNMKISGGVKKSSKMWEDCFVLEIKTAVMFVTRNKELSLAIQ